MSTVDGASTGGAVGRVVRTVVPLLAGLAVLALLLAACGDSTGDSDAAGEVVPEPSDIDLGGIDVLLLGDSLSMQAEPEIRDLADRHRYRIRISATSGHTPCDAEDTLAAVLADDPPDLIVLAYAGNSWLYSSCLGGQGQSLDESVEQYRIVLGRMIDDIEAANVGVGLVGGPDWPANVLAPEVHDAVRELAEERSLGFVDGGRWVTPDRTWSETVPCRPDEPRCDDGRVRVHLRGGTETLDVHFDCESPGWTVAGNEPCPVYSAGGYRYAVAIDTLIEDLAGSMS